jgi:hypothetical protein
MATVALRSWRAAESTLLEAKADAVEAALYGLAGVDGMFTDRPELRQACAQARDLLRVEESNLRLKAERLARAGEEV